MSASDEPGRPSGCLITFAAWCAALVIGCTVAAWLAWSPFADAQHGRGSGHGGGYYGAHGAYYGPMHK